MSHVTHRMSHVTHSTRRMSHVTYEWVMSRIEWVTSHIERDAHRSKASLSETCGMTHSHVVTRLIHVSDMYRRMSDEWVTSRIQWDAHTRNAYVTWLMMNESRHVYNETHTEEMLMWRDSWWMSHVTYTMRRTHKKCTWACLASVCVWFYVWRDSFYAWHDYNERHTEEMQTYARHCLRICVAWLIHMLWRDSFRCKTCEHISKKDICET